MHCQRVALGRSNTADGPASLRCNVLFWGGLRPLRCCVASDRVWYYFSFSHSHRLSGNTMGKKRKREGFTVKIGLKKPSLLHWFFLMRKKYLYIYTVLRAIDFKISKWNLIQIKSDMWQVTSVLHPQFIMIVSHTRCMSPWGRHGYHPPLTLRTSPSPH